MNSKWHLYISILKSVIRICGVISSIITNQWIFLAINFGIAEVLGILEELKDER